MKKYYLLIALFVFLSPLAKAQCTIDSANVQPGFSPADTSLPVIVQNTVYDTFVQLYIPAMIADSTDTLTIYSVLFNSITGFPTGINYTTAPASNSLAANSWQCFTISGTVIDTPGVYPLSFLGAVHVSSALLGDTIISLAAFDSILPFYGDSAPLFSYFLKVQAPYYAPCSVDTSVTLATPGVYPVASDLPCIVQDVPYNQTVTGRIQATGSSVVSGITINFAVDSMQLDSILGLPTGISFGRSPAFVYGGGLGCVSFFGTTTDSVATYPITAYGTVWLTGSAAGQSFPYTLHGNLNQYSSFGGYYLRVVSSADSCVLTAGISDYFSSLNAQVSVFPNPNNGVFNLKVNAASPVTGQIFVYDAIGRKIYEQPIDIIGAYNTTINLSGFAAGIYSVQVHTPNGTAVKKISVQ